MTNLQLMNKLHSYCGDVIMLTTQGGQFRVVRECRREIGRLLRQAGKSNEAFWRLQRKQGVGYLIPLGRHLEPARPGRKKKVTA